MERWLMGPWNSCLADRGMQKPGCPWANVVMVVVVDVVDSVSDDGGEIIGGGILQSPG